MGANLFNCAIVSSIWCNRLKKRGRSTDLITIKSTYNAGQCIHSLNFTSTAPLSGLFGKRFKAAPFCSFCGRTLPWQCSHLLSQEHVKYIEIEAEAPASLLSLIKFRQRPAIRNVWSVKCDSDSEVPSPCWCLLYLDIIKTTVAVDYKFSIHDINAFICSIFHLRIWFVFLVCFIFTVWFLVIRSKFLTHSKLYISFNIHISSLRIDILIEVAKKRILFVVCYCLISTFHNDSTHWLLF